MIYIKVNYVDSFSENFFFFSLSSINFESNTIDLLRGRKKKGTRNLYIYIYISGERLANVIEKNVYTSFSFIRRDSVRSERTHFVQTFSFFFFSIRPRDDFIEFCKRHIVDTRQTAKSVN